MNPDTRHLISYDPSKGPLPEGYEPIPPELEPYAKEAMCGKMEGHLAPKSRNALANWASHQRKEREARRRQSGIAKTARKRNR